MQSNKMSAMSDSMIAIATGRNLVIFRTLTFSLNGRQPILKMTQTEDHQKGRTIEQFALEDKLDFSLKEVTGKMRPTPAEVRASFFLILSQSICHSRFSV